MLRQRHAYSRRCSAPCHPGVQRERDHRHARPLAHPRGYAAFSLFSGGGFGRWIGIFAAALAAISALLAIPAYPFWSLCVFALSLILFYGLAKAPERITS